MSHDPLHDVEGRSGVLYDGTLPCRICALIARAREDERQQLRARAQAAYLAAVPLRQGRMNARGWLTIQQAAALVVRLMTKED